MTKASKKPRSYYSLLSRELPYGRWGIEFGDYDRRTVSDELGEYRAKARLHERKEEFKIIKTGETQAEIDAEVSQLNAALPKQPMWED